MKSRILVISPHADDGEFGCGGTVARFLEEGKEVFYVAFTTSEKSTPLDMPENTHRDELEKAMKTLGIKDENITVFKYEVRNFLASRQEILEDLYKLGEEIKPNLVFLPSPNDTHQDHQVIAQEGFRIFKRRTMLGYEIPWNNLNFSTNAFVFLEERHLQKKIETVSCYISQRRRGYASGEFLRSLAKTRGTQIGVKYAEVFELVRWVME